MRSVAVAGLLLSLTATAAAEPLTITVEPLDSFSVDDPAIVRFGPLTYLGGAELRSRHADFGGLSGLVIGPDGTDMLMVTDTGFWLSADAVYRDGRIVDLVDAEIAPILDEAGAPMTGKTDADAEAVTLRPDGATEGQALVAFERNDRIAAYDIARDGFAARAMPLPVPDGFADLVDNRGIEALVAVPKTAGVLPGALIAIAEEGASETADTPGFIIGGAEEGRFTVTDIAGFAITDAVRLPASGDLILLERRFRAPATLHIALRHVAIGDVRPGATVTGARIAEFDLRQEIDNMEGLALHEDASGRTVLTLVSDDNFNPLQRTLLLQFELDDSDF